MRALPLLLAAAAIAACARETPDWTYEEIFHPGAETTVAAGINGAGDVVGWFREGGIVRGFLYRNGEFTVLEYPGAILTHAVWIGDDGTITGAYRPAGERSPLFRGFVRTPDGQFTDFGHPDHSSSMVNRRLADGRLVGCYHDGDLNESMRAFTFAAGEYTVLDTVGSMHNGATPDGRVIVGVSAVRERAYRIDDGVFSWLDVPRSTGSEARAVNSAGTIVGIADSADVARGFILENGRYTLFEYPEATATAIFSINERGDIVGAFERADGVRRGFLAKR